MIALYIISAIILLFLGLLFLPVDVSLSYRENLKVKFRFSGIRVYTLKEKKEGKKKVKKAKKEKAKTPKKKKTKKPSFFKKLTNKYGFTGTIRLLFGFLKDLFPHIKGLLRHIKFKRICLNIVIAEGDAAQTAISYGKVCAAAYPSLAFFNSLYGLEYKKINISSDFNSGNSKIEASLNIRLRIFFCLVAIFKIYNEYKKITARIENNER